MPIPMPVPINRPKQFSVRPIVFQNVTSSDALVTSSFLFLVVRPGVSSSVLAPSSDALVTSSFLLLVAMHLLLVTGRMREMIRVF